MGQRSFFKRDKRKEILTDISVDNVELVSVLVEELFVFWPEMNFFFKRGQNVAMSDFFIFVDVPESPECAEENSDE